MVAGAHVRAEESSLEETLELLEKIQRRILWLAVSMVHHANRARDTRSGLKVGGHQASSASMVSIMTALYFQHLKAGDRVSVKPHASPVLHAINYVLGRLDERYLTELRAYGGIQSYPSRTKDPDPVDFSTGSVGIGATASIWSAIAHRYVSTHFGRGGGTGRHIALVGDAELDEGAVWEALVDSMVPRLNEVLWVVDLNRQSLDRVVPGMAGTRIRDMFAAAGWNTITLKYGARLRDLFALEEGELLERRIDAMSNEEYQYLLRLPANELRDAVAGTGPERLGISRLLGHLDDEAIADNLRNLGGHDLGDLLEAFAATDRVTDRPSVVLAYTIKAWRLPTEGHPGNHSALLTVEQWRQLGLDLGADPGRPWANFPPGSPEGMAAAAAAERLARPEPEPRALLRPPTEFGVAHQGPESTQQALGRFLLDLSRVAPEVAARVVTVSPDVASSTNLGGWINRVGMWHMDERHDWFERDRSTLVHWHQSQKGQHIELGIAEVNLVGLLSELGLTWSRDGEPLLPIGTLYDPFITRALEPWSFGIYAGGQSILVGTPSGITLSPEGGAHQSVITPSVGLEQPQLHGLGTGIRPGPGVGPAARFGSPRLDARHFGVLSAELPAHRPGALRFAGRPGGARAAPAGSAGRRLPAPPVRGAADGLPGGHGRGHARGPGRRRLRSSEDGVACDVICLTSADLVFRASRPDGAWRSWPTGVLDTLFPLGRAAPVVAVLDGHPHTLSFLGTINSAPNACLGVSDFGQCGEIDDLYRHFGIDAPTIIGAAWDLLDEVEA